MNLANTASRMLSKKLIKKTSIIVLFLLLSALFINLHTEQPIFDSLRKELRKTKNISKQIKNPDILCHIYGQTLLLLKCKSLREIMIKQLAFMSILAIQIL